MTDAQRANRVRYLKKKRLAQAKEDAEWKASGKAKVAAEILHGLGKDATIKLSY